MYLQTITRVENLLKMLWPSWLPQTLRPLVSLPALHGIGLSHFSRMFAKGIDRRKRFLGPSRVCIFTCITGFHNDERTYTDHVELGLPGLEWRSQDIGLEVPKVEGVSVTAPMERAEATLVALGGKGN